MCINLGAIEYDNIITEVINTYSLFIEQIIYSVITYVFPLVILVEADDALFAGMLTSLTSCLGCVDFFVSG